MIAKIATLAAAASASACGAPSTSVSTPHAPATAAEQALRRSCRGTRLDLAWIDVTDSCHIDGSPTPNPAIAVRLEPPGLQLAAGASGEVALVFSNTTDIEQSFELTLGCALSALETEILDAAGNRADLIRTCGPGGGGCGGPTTRLDLAPRGDAVLYLPVHAVVRHEDAACELGAPEPLAPGNYILQVKSGGPFYPLELRVPITVSPASPAPATSPH